MAWRRALFSYRWQPSCPALFLCYWQPLYYALMSSLHSLHETSMANMASWSSCRRRHPHALLWCLPFIDVSYLMAVTTSNKKSYDVLWYGPHMDAFFVLWNRLCRLLSCSHTCPYILLSYRYVICILNIWTISGYDGRLSYMSLIHVPLAFDTAFAGIHLLPSYMPLISSWYPSCISASVLTVISHHIDIPHVWSHICPYVWPVS